MYFPKGNNAGYYQWLAALKFSSESEDSFSKARFYCSFTITGVVDMIGCVMVCVLSSSRQNWWYNDTPSVHLFITVERWEGQQKLNFQSLSKATTSV